MHVDWNFIARDLSKHLFSVNDGAAIERILEQARADAIRLSAPPDFWSRVAAEYEQQAQRTGRRQNEQVIEALRHNDETARNPSG